ncbi:M48 family metalloprotease [Maribius pontilimi]|uniref:M48 family metalloprotease n=1 Tax=Palleronia pontilimi TaxID=1964209 RepID=A0A934MFL2_9RHOB|nr:M48 family metalloprotease [Palleronia pontilimi]MBJ3764641.1 M48 family metalloprotease [Palleronia pontilimi]
MAGAIILGAITATSQAYATQANPYRYTGADSAEMRRNMELGVAIGQKAYSQSYELESDVIATYITKNAGYDPVEGAKFFARPAAARTSAGNLSFWGTHPPDAKRLATVIETAKKAGSGQMLVPKD